MTVLVIGQPDSGKSKLAEEKAVELNQGQKYYLATMQILDDAGKERVKRHRSMRKGKGFITLEEEREILRILPEIRDPEHATVLLECISNLAGNIMHDPSGGMDPDRVVKLVTEDVRTLSDRVEHLILVSNHFPEDASYDEETAAYIRILERINGRLREEADIVYECS